MLGVRVALLVALLVVGNCWHAIHAFPFQQSSTNRWSYKKLLHAKITVCTDQSCERQGAIDTLEYLQSRGIKAGEMGCPGKCGNGPVIGVEADDYKIIEEASLGSEALNMIVEAEQLPTKG